MTNNLANLATITNITLIAGTIGATFAPIAGGRTQTRVWVRGYGYVGTDRFQGAEERALELLRAREEAERVEEVLAALAARV